MVRCLYDRSSNIVPKPRCTATEKQYAQSALMSNCYSKSFIQRIVKTKRKSTKTFKECRATAFLPFIDGISQQLCRRLDSQGITLSSAPIAQSGIIWSTHRTPIPDRRDKIVHRIPCGSCNKVYIGEREYWNTAEMSDLCGLTTRR